MKTPLLLLSGLLSNDSVWDHQRKHLSDIASITTISSSQNTPKKMIENILDQAPQKFALAGHSMGGWLCLEVMKTAPSRVTKLCLLNTSARLDPEEKKLARQEMITEVENGHFSEVVCRLVETLVWNPSVKKEAERMFLTVGKDVFINQQKAMMMRSECVSVLSKIVCPTLVIHAAQDKVFSLEEHQELANKISEARLAIVEDSGHMSPIEMPQAITSLLRDWLTRF